MPKRSYEWTRTPSGNTFWGPLGGAGILFHHPESDTYLLGHRSPEVHHGDTWGIPGGAIDPGEQPYEAALREAREEFGQVPQHTVVNEHVAQPDPDWAYHTFTAEVPEKFDPEYANDWETQGHGWFTPSEIGQLSLHPGFAASWNSGGLTKEAKHGYFFHTAPREYREQIEKYGLLPTHEAPESPWEELEGGSREAQPTGVYMWNDPVNARGYAYNLQGNKGDHFPGDTGTDGFDESMYETPHYEEYAEGAPDIDDDEDAYYEYMDKYEKPPPEPLYDIWKVNTLGLPQVHLDPEVALNRGELSAEDAQQQMNSENHWVERPREDGTVDRWKNEPELSEGHRWYVPHAIEPARLTLHDSIMPEEMTMNNWEDNSSAGKQIPDAWQQVPLNEWNENAQKRYLGDPYLMREQEPQDQSPMVWKGY